MGYHSVGYIIHEVTLTSAKVGEKLLGITMCLNVDVAILKRYKSNLLVLVSNISDSYQLSRVLLKMYASFTIIEHLFFCASVRLPTADTNPLNVVPDIVSVNFVKDAFKVATKI